MAKMCKICGLKPATVPDRERMGRLINLICGDCHALRLKGDWKRIELLYAQREAAVTKGADRCQLVIAGKIFTELQIG